MCSVYYNIGGVFHSSLESSARFVVSGAKPEKPCRLSASLWAAAPQRQAKRSSERVCEAVWPGGKQV